ncbi:hypothetical protein HYQ46_001989 [Verticillium longisporum]|nr:hypothetical protein HYQ46_001989 [Verticillium longisporum]
MLRVPWEEITSRRQSLKAIQRCFQSQAISTTETYRVRSLIFWLRPHGRDRVGQRFLGQSSWESNAC